MRPETLEQALEWVEGLPDGWIFEAHGCVHNTGGTYTWRVELRYGWDINPQKYSANKMHDLPYKSIWVQGEPSILEAIQSLYDRVHMPQYSILAGKDSE